MIENFSINNNTEDTTCKINTISSIQSGFSANSHCFQKYDVDQPEFIQCVHAYYCKNDKNYCIKSEYQNACYFGQNKLN